MRRLPRGAQLVALAAILAGCGRPYLARDGTFAFQEPGARGAAVITANGVEFHDREDIPTPVTHRDPREPWRAPVGFILPATGRFTVTSSPTLVATPGLAVVLRPSDTRVPSWGGEVLVRIDVIAPAAEGTARMGERVVVVLHGGGEDTSALVDVALGQLAARDRIGVVDAETGVLVPMIPGSHRTFASAAVAKRAGEKRPRAPRALAAALRRAADLARGPGERRVLVISDGRGDAMTPEVKRELEALAGDGVKVSAIGAGAAVDSNGVAAIGIAGGGLVSVSHSTEARTAAIRQALPPSGDLNFKDVVLRFEGIPAPSHVLEASGGHAAWRLDAGELMLGDVRAGEARTEVVRVSVPTWVPGERFTFTVNTSFTQTSPSEQARTMSSELPCVYDDDIERIAQSRHGDVIAYASALATLKRLDAAFGGAGIERAGGLTQVARMHAHSMTLLARDTRDPAIVEQAEVLNALLAPRAR